MARVVSVKDLEGLPVGGADSLHLDFILLDPFLAIHHRRRVSFTVNGGRLHVDEREDAQADAGLSGSTAPEIDVRGLTALVFGVVKEGAAELENRGWAAFPDPTTESGRLARKTVKAMFPRTVKPFMFENF